jgi:hypothetical protein
VFGYNNDVLQPYLRRGAPNVPSPQVVTLGSNATGLLVWVAEHKQPIWLDDIAPKATAATNRLTDQIIEGRYYNLYDRTRAFAAVPITYKGRFLAILTLEVAVASSLKSFHIDLMQALADPIGVLLWKSSIFEDNMTQTNDAIDDFQNLTARPSVSLNPYRTGFIARPFDDRFDFIAKSIEKAFQTQRIRATTYRATPGGTLIVSEMLAQLNAAHFGIADITLLNGNVLVEVGALIATGKPVVLLKRVDDDSKLPFDIAGYPYYSYEVDGQQIIIRDAVSARSLQEFVGSLVSDRLMTEKLFQDAKEWLGT